MVLGERLVSNGMPPHLTTVFKNIFTAVDAGIPNYVKIVSAWDISVLSTVIVADIKSLPFIAYRKVKSKI